jgi:hypothetical protein
MTERTCARPLRSVASRHSRGLPAGQAVRPIFDALMGDASPGIISRPAEFSIGVEPEADKAGAVDFS